MIELILGGARSGKSRLAESRVMQWSESSLDAGSDSRFKDTGENIIYIATASAGDQEMQQRIELHKSRRPAHWQLIEEPLYLAEVLKQNNRTGTIILIDCLTLWLSNLLCHQERSIFLIEKKQFLTQLQETQADIVMVSNETGMGVVPMGELTRRYVDESGWLHQELAQISDKVTLVVAGLEHALKNNFADGEL